MRLWFRLSYFLLALCVSSAIMTEAYAGSVSLREAVSAVQQKYQGKVLKTSQVTIKKQTFYRVKLVTEKGRVITVLVNAENGRMRKE